MSFYNSGKTKLYFQQKGRGRTVVFLHGFSLDSSMWEDQYNYFARKYHVVICDARGHGMSGAPETGYTCENRVRDTLNLVEYLNLGKIHLVGHSMGGGDALNLAINHQEKLLSLTLVGTVAAGWKSSRRFYDYVPVAREEGVHKARFDYLKSVLVNYSRRNPALS